MKKKGIRYAVGGTFLIVVLGFFWLRSNGGYCDCEVLANVEQHWQDANRNVDC